MSVLSNRSITPGCDNLHKGNIRRRRIEHGLTLYFFRLVEGHLRNKDSRLDGIMKRGYSLVLSAMDDSSGRYERVGLLSYGWYGNYKNHALYENDQEEMNITVV